MFTNQLKILDETASELIQKSKMCTKASDAESFFSMALKCYAEIRAIRSQMAFNSLLVYVECCLKLEKVGEYWHYTEFCARNRLEILSETDFKTFLDGIGL